MRFVAENGLGGELGPKAAFMVRFFAMHLVTIRAGGRVGADDISVLRTNREMLNVQHLLT